MSVYIAGRTFGALPAQASVSGLDAFVAKWPACAAADFPAIPGDLTGDGAVGVADLLVLLAAWGSCAEPRNCPADLDGDGSVGVSDLLILLANWTG